MQIAVFADLPGLVGLRFWAQDNLEMLFEPEIVSDRDLVLTLFLLGACSSAAAVRGPTLVVCWRR